MHKFKLVQVFVFFSIVYIGIGLLSSLIYYLFIPQHYFSFYPAIIVFYWICGIILNIILAFSHNKKPDQLLNIYMMGRMAKFLLTIIFLLVYVLCARDSRVPFAIALMTNFFIYTGLEIFIYYIYTKPTLNDAKEK
jgi:hypothetical protein